MLEISIPVCFRGAKIGGQDSGQHGYKAYFSTLIWLVVVKYPRVDVECDIVVVFYFRTQVGFCPGRILER